MAQQVGSRPKRRRRPLISPVLRPLAWSALLSAAVAFAFASPVYADPALPTTVPDAGARPAAVGALLLPGATGPTPGQTGPATPAIAAAERAARHPDPGQGDTARPARRRITPASPGPRHRRRPGGHRRHRVADRARRADQGAGGGRRGRRRGVQGCRRPSPWRARLRSARTGRAQPAAEGRAVRRGQLRARPRADPGAGRRADGAGGATGRLDAAPRTRPPCSPPRRPATSSSKPTC